MRTATVPLVTAGPILMFGRVVAAAARRLVGALDRWQARRDALRQLYMVDCRTLRDIGIDRSELPSIVYGSARRERRCHGGR